MTGERRWLWSDVFLEGCYGRKKPCSTKGLGLVTGYRTEVYFEMSVMKQCAMTLDEHQHL